MVDMGAYERQDASCLTDVDGDAVIGFQDLLLVLQRWGTCAQCREDFDCNGLVGVGGLGAELDTWGPCR